MSLSAPVIAYLSLGSNLGDRQAQLAAAIERIRRLPETSLEAVSRVLENPAVGGPVDSPPFLNQAVRIQTTLGSHALLKHTLQIERDLGRQQRQRWAPREIDVDILLYGDKIISSDELVIPHPLMHERRFVLEPLAEIAPDALHPVLQMTVRGLLDNLDRSLSASDPLLIAPPKPGQDR
jgi:2-amino-4-hydroxy-6-hydroxymethyldihydropteridine diphosphokinase